MKPAVRRLTLTVFAGLAVLVVYIAIESYCGRGPLACTFGVTVEDIPATVRILEADGAPAANLRIECRAASRDGTVVTTDGAGRAECRVPAISEKKFYGPFLVRRTYNTHDLDVFELRPDGTRRLLKPVEFSRTPRSVAIVCQRQAVAEL